MLKHSHSKPVKDFRSNQGRQEPFSRVAPVISAALLLGTGGGFVLARYVAIRPIWANWSGIGHLPDHQFVACALAKEGRAYRCDSCKS